MATLAVCIVLLAYSVPRACAGSAHAAEIPHKFHSIEDAVNREVSTNQANEVHREQMNEYRKRQEAAVLYFKRWDIWNDKTDAWLDDQAPLNETPRQRTSRRQAQKEARLERDNHRRSKDMTDTLGFAKEGGEVAVQESADPRATPGRTGRFSESNEQAASSLASSLTSVSESYVLTEKEAEEELNQCPMDLDTCVNRHKLIDFLAMKFIPGRTLLPEDMDKGRGVSEGHIFTEKTIPASPRVLMADWVAYILGRPKEAVPKLVRDLLRPEGMDDTSWPGSLLPRTVFLPDPSVDK